MSEISRDRLRRIDNREFTPDEIARLLQWRPASGHPGGWRVMREDFRSPPLFKPKLQAATGPKGKLCLFRTMEAAQRRADEMNRAARETAT